MLELYRGLILRYVTSLDPLVSHANPPRRRISERTFVQARSLALSFDDERPRYPKFVDVGCVNVPRVSGSHREDEDRPSLYGSARGVARC